MEYANNPALNEFLQFRKDAGVPTPGQLGDAAAAAMNAKAGANAAAAGHIKENIKKRDLLTHGFEMAPKAPKIDTKLPDPPQQNFKSPTEAFTTLGPVLAVFGSLLTRRPMVTAMKAATAAMKGFHQGDQEVYERQRQVWGDNLKKALEQNRAELDEYYAAADEHRNNMAAMQAKMTAIAASNQDWATMAALQGSGGTAAVFERLKMMNDAGEKLMDQFNTYLKTKGGMIDDNYYEQWKLQPENVVAADAWAKGLPPSDYVRGRGASADREFSMIKRLGAERHPDLDLSKVVKDYKAEVAGSSQEARSIATRSAPAKIAVAEMDKLGPPMLDAFKAIDPTKYPTINSVRNAAEKGLGDANVVKANFALQSFKTAFTNLMVRNGVPTDQARSKADDLMALNFNVDQVQGIIDQAKIEGGAVIDALEEAKSKKPKDEKVIHWDDLPE